MNIFKKILKIQLVLTASLIFFGCSTAIVRVLPGQKGINKVFARDIEIEGAEVAAHEAASEYCEKHNQEAIFLKEKSKYTGKIDENSRKGVRAAAKAITYIPGASVVGSVVKSTVDDRDYHVGALFRCRDSTN